MHRSRTLELLERAKSKYSPVQTGGQISASKVYKIHRDRMVLSDDNCSISDGHHDVENKPSKQVKEVDTSRIIEEENNEEVINKQYESSISEIYSHESLNDEDDGCKEIESNSSDHAFPHLNILSVSELNDSTADDSVQAAVGENKSVDSVRPDEEDEPTDDEIIEEVTEIKTETNSVSSLSGSSHEAQSHSDASSCKMTEVDKETPDIDNKEFTEFKSHFPAKQGPQSQNFDVGLKSRGGAAVHSQSLYQAELGINQMLMAQLNKVAVVVDHYKKDYAESISHLKKSKHKYPRVRRN